MKVINLQQQQNHIKAVLANSETKVVFKKLPAEHPMDNITKVEAFFSKLIQKKVICT